MKTVILLLVIFVNPLFSQQGMGSINDLARAKNCLCKKKLYLNEDSFKSMTIDSLINLTKMIEIQKDYSMVSRSMVFMEAREMENKDMHSLAIISNDTSYLLLINKNENISYFLYKMGQSSLVVYNRDDWWAEFKRYLNQDGKVIIII